MSDCTECGWPVATDADNDRPCDDHCDHCRGLCWHEFTGVHRDDVRPDAAIATLTHRAEVAERSCEDAKRREQEASAKMQAMAQSESNKALRARAEAAERELAEVHRGVESVALHDARVARDAATARAEAAERALQDLHETYLYEACTPHVIAADEAEDVATLAMSTGLAECERLRESAALWRERCNAAEARTLYAGRSAEEWYVAAQQADARVEASEQSRSLCIEALRGVQATGDVDAQTWDVVADGIRALRERCTAAEERAGTWMWQRTEVLHSLRRARFLAAGWRRLARHYQSCHLAGHACLRETHRAKGEQVAALRRARDDDAAYRSDLMEQCDALRAKLARAEGVVGVVRAMPRCECRDGVQCDSCAMTDREWNDAMRPIVRDCRAALATYEEG